MKTKILNRDGSMTDVVINSWKDIAPAIGATTFAAVRLYDEDRIIAYVDDEGMFNPDWFWIHKNYPTPIAGYAIFFGTDDEGNDVELSDEKFENIRKDIRMVNKFILMNISKLGLVKDDDYRPHFFRDAA